MGFSIGRLLGKLAPAIGGLFGPLGGAVGGAIGAGFSGPDASRAAGIGRQTLPGPVTGGTTGGANIQSFAPQIFLPSSVGPSAALARVPSVGRQALSLFGFNGGAGPAGNGQASPVSRILAKARAATGGPVTRNKIIDSAKVCGLEITAQTFGLEVTEVCMVVVRGRTRRRRGVSAADIRRTKRTIGFASKIRKDLKALAR